MTSQPQQLSKDEIQDRALSMLEELDHEEKLKVLEYLQSLVNDTDE